MEVLLLEENKYKNCHNNIIKNKKIKKWVMELEKIEHQNDDFEYEKIQTNVLSDSFKKFLSNN